MRAPQRARRNDAGARNTKVYIEKATDGTPNATGEVLPVFTQFCSRYAEEMMTSGREFLAAMQVVGMLQGIIKIPYDSETKRITGRDRLKIGDRTLNLACPPINEGGHNEKIVLWCVEVD